MMFNNYKSSPHHGTRRTVLSVAIAAALAGGGAQAQTASETGDKDDLAELLEEIVVTAQRANLKRAIEVKKEETLIADVIAADNLGVMPNVTVAESLVRLPGVNGARDRGNESLVSVRGLGQRLTLGLINGREIASSDPGRAVRWEVFPTEVVSKATVYKSQSADLIAGGIGATIDIGTVDPLEYKGKSAAITAGPVYYTQGKDIPDYDPWGGRFGASWIHKINEDLGVAFGATYQKQRNANSMMGSNGYNTTQAADVTGGDGVTPGPWGGGTELKKIEQERKGAMAALQWRSGNLEVKADALYSMIGIDENQSQTKFDGWSVAPWGNPYENGDYVLSDGDIVGGSMPNTNLQVDHTIGRWVEDKWLTAYGVNAEWSGDAWTFTGDLSSSSAKRDGNWGGVWFKTWPQSVSYNFLGKPWIKASDAELFGDSSAMEASNWGPDTVRDQIDAIAFNAERDLNSSVFTSLEFGVRLANREKQHRHYEWKPEIISQSIEDYEGLLSWTEMPGLDVPQMLAGNPEAVAEVAIGGWDPSRATEGLLDHWDVEEDIREAFVKADYDSTAFGIPVTGNIGVRVVDVETTSAGFDGVGGGWYQDTDGIWKERPYEFSPSTGGTSYTDVLPSATMNLMLDEDHILRLGLAKVVSRPPLDELRTGRSLDVPNSDSNDFQLQGSGGNPSLDPFRATQFDLSYEWYFHDEALAAIAYYYKSVDTVIGYRQTHQMLNGFDYQIMAPDNGDGGHINGVELTFKTPFYFIPGGENFGINANYAYVDSNLRELAPEEKPLPMSGLTKDTVAVDLWYNNGIFELGLGYKYHSPYSIVFGWTPSQLSTLKSETTLDLYSSYQITDDIRLKLSAANLTDEPLSAYIDNQPNRLGNKQGSGGYQLYGRRISLEATVTF